MSDEAVRKAAERLAVKIVARLGWLPGDSRRLSLAVLLASDPGFKAAVEHLLLNEYGNCDDALHLLLHRSPSPVEEKAEAPPYQGPHVEGEI